jgi:hypothetical protein
MSEDMQARKPQIRLVKVIVQPVFVLDDGEHIIEIEHQPTMIPAVEWPTYSSERFPREVKEWQAQLDRENEPKTTANRAGRRAKAKPKAQST